MCLPGRAGTPEYLVIDVHRRGFRYHVLGGNMGPPGRESVRNLAFGESGRVAFFTDIAFFFAFELIDF